MLQSLHWAVTPDGVLKPPRLQHAAEDCRNGPSQKLVQEVTQETSTLDPCHQNYQWQRNWQKWSRRFIFLSICSKAQTDKSCNQVAQEFCSIQSPKGKETGVATDSEITSPSSKRSSVKRRVSSSTGVVPKTRNKNRKKTKMSETHSLGFHLNLDWQYKSLLANKRKCHAVLDPSVPLHENHGWTS